MGAPLAALDNPIDLLILLVIAVLIFGKQLPEVARSVGKGIRELRESANFHELSDALNSVNEVRSAVSPAGILRAAIPDELSSTSGPQSFPGATEVATTAPPPFAPPAGEPSAEPPADTPSEDTG